MKAVEAVRAVRAVEAVKAGEVVEGYGGYVIKVTLFKCVNNSTKAAPGL